MNNNINVEKYLQENGIRIQSKRAKQIIVECPINSCHSGSKSKKPRLYFNTDTGKYFCHNCGEKGNLITLAKMLGVPLPDSSFTRYTEQEKQETSNNKTEYIWSKATTPPSNHPYLLKKKIGPSIARYSPKNGCLLVPVYNSENKIQSIQFINSRMNITSVMYPTAC